MCSHFWTVVPKVYFLVAGGQYTNLQFQAFSLGLADQFEEVKKMFKVANKLLGDIVKVSRLGTPEEEVTALPIDIECLCFCVLLGKITYFYTHF